MKKLTELEPNNSPYASALVLVKKKNGGLQICISYRGMSKGTVADRFPMPRIDELVDMVGCSNIFSSLGLM